MSKPQLTPREYAYVMITGPGSHKQVTAQLNLKPSEAWDAGDINVKSGKAFSSMCWVLRSELDDTVPLDNHIQALLTTLGTRLELLPLLWVSYDITLQCVGYYPSSTGSGMHFNREVVRKAAQLGVALDLDHYFVKDHGHAG